MENNMMPARAHKRHIGGVRGQRMRFVWVVGFTILAGCGSAYISPSVKETSKDQGAAIDVDVVQVTPAVVREANRSKYKPKTLPLAFSQYTVTRAANRVMPDLPAAPTPPAAPPQPLELRLPPPLKPQPYEIGVSDVLLLSTPNVGSTVEELSGLLAAQNKRQGYTVQDDGTIAIPDVGRVKVEMLTLEEAEAEIFKALVKRQVPPTFVLEIAEFNSQRVSVGGAVAKPTLVPITLKPLTLGDALQVAGGLATRDKDLAVIRLYRDGKLYQIPLRDYLRDGKLQKLLLKDGDSIFVDTSYDLARAQAYFKEQIEAAQLTSAARAQALQELTLEFNLRKARADELRNNFKTRVDLDALPRDYIYLAGEVARQGRFTLPFNRKATLADALFSASGITTREGNVAQIYVLRGNKAGDRVTAYQLDARNIAMMTLATRLELRPNDIVFVAEQPVTKWNRVVSQIGPSLITGAAAKLP